MTSPPRHAPVAWFDSAWFDAHDAPWEHPERPQRLWAVRSRLETSGLATKLRRIPADPVRPESLRLVHPKHYLADLENLAQRGGGELDSDTYVAQGSWEAALRAAGAVEQAVRGVLEGSLLRAFCSVRPPGHHAERARGMGFCLLNNVAIGAEVALTLPGVARVAIYDFDVHHGNGTEEIFYDRGDVFYASTHQLPAYPGTGRAADRGEGEGRDRNLNVPLTAWSEVIEPALTRFRPDLLILSAGFDADQRDPLAELAVTPDGFTKLSKRLVSFAEKHCAGRLVSVLEGGYDLVALADDVQAHVGALL